MLIAGEEARECAGHASEFAGVESADHSVVLAPERGYCGRPDFDAPINGHGEVNTKERVSGIRYGVNMPLQCVHRPIAVPIQTLKWQHSVVQPNTKPVGDRVGVEPCGIN